MTRTASQLAIAIGQTVLWCASRDISVTVRVLDAKQSYGQVRLLIAPINGTGQQWIDVSSLRRADTALAA